MKKITWLSIEKKHCKMRRKSFAMITRTFFNLDNFASLEERYKKLLLFYAYV